MRALPLLALLAAGSVAAQPNTPPPASLPSQKPSASVGPAPHVGVDAAVFRSRIEAVTCAGFASAAEAQAALAAGHAGLDPDGDGLACEEGVGPGVTPPRPHARRSGGG